MIHKAATGKIEFEWPASFEQVRAKYFTRTTIVTGDEGSVSIPKIYSQTVTRWIVTLEVFGRCCVDCGESAFTRSEKSCHASGQQHNFENTFFEVARGSGLAVDEALKEADRFLQQAIIDRRI